MNSMPTMHYLSGALTLRFDPARCTGCGRCEEVCPHGAFACDGPRARLVFPERCMECGACAKNCPDGAIAVSSGVGCATAFINRMLGRSKGCGCESEGCCA